MMHYSDRDLSAANLLAMILMGFGNIWLLWSIIMSSTLCSGMVAPHAHWLGVLYFL